MTKFLKIQTLLNKQLWQLCYGQPQSSTMTEVGRSSGLASKHLTTPKLCSLPSTTDAFILLVKRAHLQVQLLKCAQKVPLNFDSTDFGWQNAFVNK